jgi:hypothetical protein
MSKRTWTDAQLCDVVEGARSWRAVLEALGLKATSAGSLRAVQRRASELDLKIDHFRRNRTWTDGQLGHAIESSASWGEVIKCLKLTYDGQAKGRLKGHALRLGLDVGHLESDRPHRPSLEHLIGDPHPSELRYAAHTLAAAWFSLRGFPVAFPTDPCPYDLLLTTPAGFQRAQVKSTTFQIQDGKWQVGIGHRPYALDKSASKDPYDPDEVDLFVIVTGDGGLYVIPIEAVAGYTAIYLSSYEEYRVGDVSSMMN